MKIWRIALKFGPKISQASSIKTVWGICVFQNWSPAMAFFVTHVAKYLVIKIDNKKLQNNQWEMEKTFHSFDDWCFMNDIMQ